MTPQPDPNVSRRYAHFRKDAARIAMVSADYDEAKREASFQHSVTIRIWERKWKLKAGQLRHFRANRPRLKNPIPSMEW